ncbi:MAG: TonB-dependent receptor [Thermodesulfovibrionales bacterium]|nr:TonB-dependent receptor [Thermodesulfovibrionales bacterium]
MKYFTDNLPHLLMSIIFSVLIISMVLFSQSASAVSEAEKNFLYMYFSEDELTVVSATRSLKSITRVAENISVVTKEDIELMNAHTVAEALQKVNGVQIEIIGGPGAFAYPYIQGSEFRHVAVFMDGVLINMFSDNVADIAMIPVQHIEKIEIIKGPASSVWGSSLGGVINIITKSGSNKEKSGGALSGAYGERGFYDLRTEVYGKKEKTKYYFYAGRLDGDGFRGLPDNSGNSLNDLYMKASQYLTSNSEIVLTTFYNRGERGEGYPIRDYLDNKKIENLFTSLSLNTSMGKETMLSISGKSAMRDWKYNSETISPASRSSDYHSKDNDYGFSAKITSNPEGHALVAGVDYDKGVVHTYDPIIDLNRNSKIRKRAVYVNDTIALGKFSVTPGVRYDNENLIGDFISPSLGLTYDLYEKTLLRAYAARGFSSPPSPWGVDNIVYGYKGNPNLKPEKVWSYQLGFETGVLKYLWLKTSAFRHEIRDAINQNKEIVDDPVYTNTSVNEGKTRRQGLEAEIKTLPFYHLTLSAGATYIQNKNRITGETIRDYPKYSYDAGIKYDDEKSWKALLTGHYTWWDSMRAGKYDSFLVDFNISKRFYKQANRESEVFATVHNVFDAAHQTSISYRYPDRWMEAGIRFKF